MQKNVASQKFVVFAFDITTGAAKTGDAANITANIKKDYGTAAATNDVNPTETEDGYYQFDATQAETNADAIQVLPQSSTADIQVISVPGVIFTTPANFGNDVIQTGDVYPKVDTEIADILTDTGTTLNNLIAAIQADMDNTTDGFGALKLLIDGVQNDLDNGADGLGALKTLLDTLIARLTAARAGYLDKLNITGNVAASSEVTAIQNNTRVRVMVPHTMERPDSGSTAFKLHLYIYDEAGNMEAPDSAPTITAENETGTSRSANLGVVTLESAGHYSVTYTLASGDGIEQLIFEWTVTEGAVARLHGSSAQVVDTSAVDFTSADRAKLDTLHDTRITAGRAGNLDNLDKAITALNDIAATDIVSNGAINTLAGAVQNVDLVDACTSNTDMRGTDGAFTGNEASIRAEIDTNSTQIAQILADIGGLNDPTAAAIASAVLTTAMSESYAAKGAAGTLPQILYFIQQLLVEFAISGTAYQINKLDGVTPAASLTLDDANSPTSMTRAT